jgi:hypothetical protein
MADKTELFPWPSNVVGGKQLNIAMAGALPANGWLPALKAAIQFFNTQMTSSKIALSFAMAAKASGAHVVMEGVSGNGIHGQAELGLTSRRGGKEFLAKVTIKVPATPRVSERDPKSRIVGDGIKTCILVHEMIHGLGLDNFKHTPGDVFSKSFQLIEGSAPNLDKMQWDASSPSMPPPVISGVTMKKIKSVWTA